VALKSAISATAVKTDIEAALKRSAEVDAHKIGVDTNGHTVTLTGRVRSSNERKEAERAAWGGAWSLRRRQSNRRQPSVERVGQLFVGDRGVRAWCTFMLGVVRAH